MSVTVDPEVLRAFAGQVDTATTSIEDSDVGRRVASAADGLAGSTTQWAARIIGSNVTAQANMIATNVDEMGQAVRGAGNAYDVTDSDLAKRLMGIF
jgi:hypothetical protein